MVNTNGGMAVPAEKAEKSETRSFSSRKEDQTTRRSIPSNVSWSSISRREVLHGRRHRPA
jgi:hypothetical protein